MRIDETKTAPLQEDMKLRQEKVSHQVIFLEMRRVVGFLVFDRNLVSNVNGAGSCLQLRFGQTRNGNSIVGQALDAYGWPVSQDTRPIPAIEDRDSTRSQMIPDSRQELLDIQVGRLVASNVKNRCDYIEFSSEPHRPNVAQGNIEIRKPLLRPVDHCLRIINADDVVAEFPKESRVDSGTATEIQHSPASHATLGHDGMQILHLGLIIFIRVK
jgi:hypothetical protein